MKRLYKERFDKKFMGVCGGLAQYFRLDASVIRLVFVVATILSGGLFILFYLLLGLLMPLGPKSYVLAHYKKLYRSKKDRVIAGVCGGIGKYLRVNPMIIRLIFVIIGIVTAVIPVIIFYFLAIGIVPEEPTH